jgi:hypothetical protein
MPLVATFRVWKVKMAHLACNSISRHKQRALAFVGLQPRAQGCVWGGPDRISNQPNAVSNTALRNVAAKQHRLPHDGRAEPGAVPAAAWACKIAGSGAQQRRARGTGA